MRYFLVLAILCTLPVAHVAAQSGQHPPNITVSPPVGDISAQRTVVSHNLPAGAPVITALFDPAGSQTVTTATVSGDGSLTQPLPVPADGWKVGQYRWVVGLANGKSYSQTFVVSDGAPHLFAQPNLPSPTSAFNFVGIGFPRNQSISLLLFLTGAGGQHPITVTTDETGSFSTFVFPQGFNEPFFSAGAYKITAPDQSLSTDFSVREHPVSSTVLSGGPVELGGFLDLRFQNYPRYRYLWGVYADMTGHLQGEFLVGPTSISGALEVVTLLDQLAPGKYVVATPYDWGEGTFEVPERPTPMPSATPNPTSTMTATAAPIKHACKKKSKVKRKKCKKV